MENVENTAGGEAAEVVAVLEGEDLPALDLRQARALAELLVQPTLIDAARAADVDVRTLRKWRVENPVFIKHYRNARREIFSRTVQALHAYAPRVTAQLQELMQTPDLPAKDRLSASRTLLEFAFRASEGELVNEPGQIEEADTTHEAIVKARHGCVHRFAPIKPRMEPLTESQDRAIVALTQHPTVAEAAKAASVGLRTLQEWLSRHANFMRHYAVVRRELHAQTVKSLQELVPKVIEGLFAMSGDLSLPVSVRIAAGRTVLAYARRADELLSSAETIETRHEAAMATERKRQAEYQRAHPYG
jgi:hypothetical protein